MFPLHYFDCLLKKNPLLFQYCIRQKLVEKYKERNSDWMKECLVEVIEEQFADAFSYSKALLSPSDKLSHCEASLPMKWWWLWQKSWERRVIFTFLANSHKYTFDECKAAQSDESKNLDKAIFVIWRSYHSENYLHSSWGAPCHHSKMDMSVVKQAKTCDWIRHLSPDLIMGTLTKHETILYTASEVEKNNQFRL